jgi:hypothetical protein
MTDARYESARATNQAPCRGWDFTPAKPRRYPVNLIKTCAVLIIGVCAVAAALAVIK